MRCLLCRHQRSFTLMTPNGVCGLCATPPCTLAADTSPTTPPLGDTTSYWCECRTCAALYAVERVDALQVVPKCHFCRAGAPAPTVSCVTCLNAFICMPGVDVGERSAFVCPPCAQGAAPPDHEVSLTVEDYIRLDAARPLAGHRILDPDALFSAAKPAPLLRACGVERRVEHDFRPDTRSPAVMLEHKPLKNADSHIRPAILRFIEHNDRQTGTCLTCFEDTPHSRLTPACGRSGCRALCCATCMDNWYGDSKPGANLRAACLLCPFCKKAPAPGVLRRHNKQLRALKVEAELDPGVHYAWCITCYKAAELAPRVCAQEAPLVARFKCRMCAPRYNDPPQPLVKPCPGCTVMTEKTSGCDHITCPSCQLHWCFQCSFSAPHAPLVYDHMWAAHGGLGFALRHNDDDHDENDYENDYDSDADV